MEVPSGNEQLNNTENYRAVKVTPPPCMACYDCGCNLVRNDVSVGLTVSGS